MNPGVTPETITITAFVTQILLMVILLMGAGIIATAKGVNIYNSRWRTEEIDYYTVQIFSLLRKKIPFFIVLTFVLSIVIFIVSDAIQPTWKPLLGLNTLCTGATAKLFMFIADIVLLSWLIYLTGGSSVSPFSPVLFLIPSLAIFLREPPNWLLVYFIATFISFTINMFAKKFQSINFASASNWQMRFSFWLMTLLSLTLTTYIGFLTRPT
jgi:hypothetical protein